MICSDIDEDTCDLYTSGDCYVLAKELLDQDVGELSAVVVQDRWDCWTHMAVKIGPDSYLDVEGISSSEELIECHSRGSYKMTIIPIDEEEYSELVTGQHQQIESPEKVTMLAEALLSWLEELE